MHSLSSVMIERLIMFVISFQVHCQLFDLSRRQSVGVVSLLRLEVPVPERHVREVSVAADSVDARDGEDGIRKLLSGSLYSVNQVW